MTITGMWTLTMISFLSDPSGPVITPLFTYQDSNWAFRECIVEKDNMEKHMESLGVPLVYFTCTKMGNA